MNSRQKARHRNPLQKSPTHLNRLRLLVLRRRQPPRPAFRPILPKPTPGSEHDVDGSEETPRPLRGVVLPSPSESLASGHNISARSSRPRAVRRKLLLRGRPRRSTARSSTEQRSRTDTLCYSPATTSQRKQDAKPYDALFVASIGTDLAQHQSYDPVLVTLSCRPYMSIIPTRVVQRHGLPKLPLTPTQKSSSYRTIFGYYEPKKDGYYTKLCIRSPKHGLHKGIQIALLIADFDLKDLTEELATCYRDHDLFLGSEFIDRLKGLMLTLDINGSTYGALQPSPPSRGSSVNAESAEPPHMDLLSDEEESQEAIQQLVQSTSPAASAQAFVESLSQQLLSEGSYSSVASTSFRSEEIFSQHGYAPSTFTDLTMTADHPSPHMGLEHSVKPQEPYHSDWSSSGFDPNDQASDASVVSTNPFNALAGDFDPNMVIDMEAFQVFVNSFQQMPMPYSAGPSLYDNLFQEQMRGSSTGPDLSMAPPNPSLFHPKMLTQDHVPIPRSQGDVFNSIISQEDTIQ